jgi:hypothetical protein
MTGKYRYRTPEQIKRSLERAGEVEEFIRRNGSQADVEEHLNRKAGYERLYKRFDEEEACSLREMHADFDMDYWKSKFCRRREAAGSG